MINRHQILLLFVSRLIFFFKSSNFLHFSCHSRLLNAHYTYCFKYFSFNLFLDSNSIFSLFSCKRINFINWRFNLFLSLHVSYFLKYFEPTPYGTWYLRFILMEVEINSRFNVQWHVCLVLAWNCCKNSYTWETSITNPILDIKSVFEALTKYNSHF